MNTTSVPGSTRSSRTPTRYGRIFPPDEDWLATAAAETLLDPELPIVDAHHHLWDLRSSTGHRYLLDDFLSDAGSGHNVVASIYMNCYEWYRLDGPVDLRCVNETEVAAGAAAMCDSGIYGPIRVAAGIVGFADLTLGDAVRPVLEAHVAAGKGRFRGVRHSGGWDADPVIGNSFADIGRDFYARADFRLGLKRLTEMGLSFDAWLYHPQLMDLIDLAHAFPETAIIAGHCGCPLGYGAYSGRRDEVFARWKASMTELARCPNVVIKLGGMMMRLASYDYNTLPRPPTSVELADMWRPYIETCIELFGTSPAGAVGYEAARHAGNLLILSHLSHHRYGRHLTRKMVTEALRAGGKPRSIQFVSAKDKPVGGVVVEIDLAATGEKVSIFFTMDHRDYWLANA